MSSPKVPIIYKCLENINWKSEWAHQYTLCFSVFVKEIHFLCNLVVMISVAISPHSKLFIGQQRGQTFSKAYTLHFLWWVAHVFLDSLSVFYIGSNCFSSFLPFSSNHFVFQQKLSWECSEHWHCVFCSTLTSWLCLWWPFRASVLPYVMLLLLMLFHCWRWNIGPHTLDTHSVAQPPPLKITFSGPLSASWILFHKSHEEDFSSWKFPVCIP